MWRDIETKTTLGQKGDCNKNGVVGSSGYTIHHRIQTENGVELRARERKREKSNEMTQQARGRRRGRKRGAVKDGVEGRRWFSAETQGSLGAETETESKRECLGCVSE